MAKDLVCGMKVDEENAEHKMEYNGKTYYFCAGGCKKSFEENPEKYISSESDAESSESEMEIHHEEREEDKPWWKFW